MTTTTELYRNKIQKAKAQLIESAIAWLRTESHGLSSAHIANWIGAIRSSSSDELQSALQRSAFPLLRQDTLVPVHSTEVGLARESATIEQRTITRRVYQVNATLPTPILTKLCQITTLLEQLHQLEELLVFNQSQKELIPFSTLSLAFQMARSINKEWRYVAFGIETVKYYTQRLQEAKVQFEISKQECGNSIKSLEGPLKISSEQFRATLVFLATSIGQVYALVKDDRIFVEIFGYRLRGYLPWHLLLNQMASELFGLDGFVHPNPSSITISPRRVEDIIKSINNEIQRPYNELLLEYKGSSEKANHELVHATNKLESLTAQVRVQFNTDRNAPFLFSTYRLGLFSLIQAFHSFSGQPFAPTISQENQARSAVPSFH